MGWDPGLRRGGERCELFANTFLTCLLFSALDLCPYSVLREVRRSVNRDVSIVERFYKMEIITVKYKDRKRMKSHDKIPQNLVVR